MPTRRELAAVAVAVGIVGVLTAVVSAGALSLRSLAATPRDVEHGRVWLLVTSALVADHPIGASLAAFAGLALAAAVVCGPRVAIWSAVAGHLGATAVVYVTLFAARAVDPHVLGGAAAELDYGVSAIFAAWLGSVAAVEWRRHPGRRVIVAAAVVLGGVGGWFLDSDRSPLDAEHVVALALGILVARSVRDGHEVEPPRRRGRAGVGTRTAVEQARELRRRLLDHRPDERPNHVA